MIRFSTIAVILGFLMFSLARQDEAAAQRLYYGSTPDLTYQSQVAVDANGRPVIIDNQLIDPYGPYYSGNGYPANIYSNRGFYSGYSGMYSRIYAPPVVGGTYGPSYVVPSRSVIVGGTYPSRTVLNNATRGTVIEYTHNGNGYISEPGSTYQTVISSGPSILPDVAVVQPADRPVVIESRPTGHVVMRFSGQSQTRHPSPQPLPQAGQIELILPKEATGPLTYTLNGTIYTIKPGYSQTFPEDRNWFIEFLQRGTGSSMARYQLTAGTYRFVNENGGWDLKLYPAPASSYDIPPSPPPLDTKSAPPIPSPDLK